MADLTPFFQPKSIALVGASERQGSLAGAVARQLSEHEFDQPVITVNLKPYQTVYGYPCFRYLRDVDLPIDLAVISVPRAALFSVLRQIGRRKIKSVIILGAGLSSEPTLQTSDYEKIARYSKDYGFKVIGPHSMGVLSPYSGFYASCFHRSIGPGHVAYVGHSAAVGASLLDWAVDRGLGFSHFLTLGASVGVRASDVLDYLATDRRVKTILIHLEQIRDANRLLIALRAASRSKNVVVMRTQASLTDTPGLLDSSSLEKAFFERSGVLTVSSITELVSGLAVLARSKPLYGPQISIVSNGTGTAWLARQAIVEGGGQLAKMQPLKSERLKEGGWHPNNGQGNPAILPSDATGADFINVLDSLVEQSNHTALFIIYSPNLWSDRLGIAEALATYIQTSRRLVLTCFLGGESTQACRGIFDSKGLLNYSTIDEAAYAFLMLTKHAEAQNKLKETPTTLSTIESGASESARAIITKARRKQRKYLLWNEGRQLLQVYGFGVVESISFKQGQAHFSQVPDDFYPVGLRALIKPCHDPFDETSHRRITRLELQNQQALNDAYNDLQSSVERELSLEPMGWAVQPMKRKLDSVQVSIGMTRHPTFGPVIFIGLGGSVTERLTDRHISFVPLNSALAFQMIHETRLFSVLKERYGEVTRMAQQLVQYCLSLSQMVVDQPRISGVEATVLVEKMNQPSVLEVSVSLGDKVRAALNPYPSELVETVKLLNGVSTLIRPIRSEDEPILAAFFKRFDANALQFRFFYSRQTFEHTELAAMCQIDYRREMVFVAVHDLDMVGEIRLWWDINKGEVEFSVMVASSFQGTGLANVLMNKMQTYAKSVGASRIRADVLEHNRAMLGLAQRHGYTIEHGEEGLQVVKLLMKD